MKDKWNVGRALERGNVTGNNKVKGVGEEVM